MKYEQKKIKLLKFWISEKGRLGLKRSQFKIECMTKYQINSVLRQMRKDIEVILHGGRWFLKC